MLILCVIATILSCIFSFVCYSILYIFIFIGICAGMLFMIEHFTFWGAFFIIEELFILIPLLIWGVDYKDKDKDKDEVKEMKEGK